MDVRSLPVPASPRSRREDFGDQWAWLAVGVNPLARLAAVNPRFEGLTLWPGVQVPSWESALDPNDARCRRFLDECALLSPGDRLALAPPESGRGVLLESSRHPVWRDIHLKGCGPVEKFTRRNRLRDDSRNFNGWLELSEALRDFVQTEILHRAGARVAPYLAVIDHRTVADFGGFLEWKATAVRAFRAQTRLSNLALLTPDQRRRAVETAMETLRRIDPADAPRDFVAYFHYLLDWAARHAAIYQATGFTQDSLHYGQMTLAGEMADLGLGGFGAPSVRGVVNTLHPWFRHERQPLLFLNFLYRTHSLKAEPDPVRLGPDSETFRRQDSLFGFLRSFDPAAARRIESADPEALFWERYEHHFLRFDSEGFRKEVLDGISRFYDWAPRGRWPRAVRKAYEDRLREIGAFYEVQAGPWSRPGLPSFLKQVLFVEALGARGQAPDVSRLRAADTGPWGDSPRDYFNRRPARRPDVSVRPGEAAALESARALVSRHPARVNLRARENRWILVVSRHGLADGAAADLHRDVVSAFDRELVGVIRPSRLPHLLYRRRFEIVDLSFDPDDSVVPRLRHLTSRPGDGTRFEPLLALSRAENARLDAYLAHIEADFEGVLGPRLSEGAVARLRRFEAGERMAIHPLHVAEVATRGELADNRLTGGGTHNCASWLLTAPLGRSGEPLHELLGMTEADRRAERVSCADAAFAFLLREAPSHRVPLIILWTDLPVHDAPEL